MTEESTLYAMLVEDLGEAKASRFLRDMQNVAM